MHAKYPRRVDVKHLVHGYCDRNDNRFTLEAPQLTIG